jgi:hypothetical protein
VTRTRSREPVGSAPRTKGNLARILVPQPGSESTSTVAPSAFARSDMARSPIRSLCHPDLGSNPCPSSWTSSETALGS